MAAMLVGSGITVSNVSFTGAQVARGVFTGGADSIGFDSGVVLSTGSIRDVTGPNDNDATGTLNNELGDPDLDRIVAPEVTEDAAVLQFNFVPSSNVISFQFVFGSEEYNEFVNSSFNDVFAFFVNGVNIALLPGTVTTISVNTVNSTSNPEFYRNNESGILDTELDGLTVVLSVQATVVSGQLNTMKLAIADTADGDYDSAVFIRASSITTTQATTMAVSPASGPSGGATNLSATLRKLDNTPVPDRRIVFSLRGVDVGAATTNSSGVATLQNVSLAGIQPGSYPDGIRARFDGDSSFNASSGSATLTVQTAQCAVSPIGFGQSISASLTDSDCIVNQRKTDLYTFSTTNANESIAISLDSAATGGIQPVVELLGPNNNQIASASGATNARIPAGTNFISLTTPGTYTIRVSSQDGGLGGYAVSLFQQTAQTCSYVVSPAVTNVGPNGTSGDPGGTRFFDVIAPHGCPSVPAALGPNSGHISIVSNSGGRVTFRVQPNQGSTPLTGTILVADKTHTINQAANTAPPNDAFGSAAALNGESGAIDGRNSNASAEGGEPSHSAGNPASHSVWYRWTAPSGGTYSFTTSGSDFDTVLAVYTGSSVNGLTQVTSNDNSFDFDNTSKVSFTAAANTVYQIAVDGKGGSVGNLRLSFRKFDRLYRIYLLNANGLPSPIVPTSVFAQRRDGTGPQISGDPVSLGVYEFRVPNDGAAYHARISGPTGIIWSPDTIPLDESALQLADSLAEEACGGRASRMCSNPTNQNPVKFTGFIEGLTTLNGLSVKVGSGNALSAVAPKDCPNPTFVPGGTGGAMRVKYECEMQPNSEHLILPSAPNVSFSPPMLKVGPVATNTESQTIMVANATATANITGRALTAGQGLAGVTIYISAGAFSSQTTSDAGGNYAFANLVPGTTYTLKAVRSGFVFQDQMVTLPAAGAIVDLSAQACTFSLSGPALFGIAGGSGQLNVVANTSQGCDWSAVRGPGSDFITINSGASVGNGQALFSIAANSGPHRMGTIVVGQNAFTIRQVGTPAHQTRFDFDGDGKADLVVRRPSNNIWYVKTAAAFTNFEYGIAGDQLAPADFDGDGFTDPAVFRPSNGTWYVKGTFDGFYLDSWGVQGDMPVPADYNGDGKDDIAVYRPSNAMWFVKPSGGGISIVQFGAAGDLPQIGDFDGDGMADRAVFRPTTNVWYLQQTSQGYTEKSWGRSGDIPVPADYDGDGRTDLAVFRPSTGQWFIISLANNAINVRQWGALNDIPVAADFDGDNKTDIAVFRPSNGGWYLNMSSAGIAIFTFGESNDNPIPSAFLASGSVIIVRPEGVTPPN